MKITTPLLPPNHNFMPDELDYASLYAFTFVPDPNCYNSAEPRKQYEALLNIIFTRPQVEKCFDRYFFIPELTLQGNVHIHGYFILLDKLPYYRWFLPLCRKYGFVKVKNRVNVKWIDYCNKDYQLTSELFEGLPFPITKETVAGKYRCKLKLKCKTIIKVPIKGKKVLPITKYLVQT